MDELRQELGRIQQQHLVAADYQKSLALLRALQAGTVRLDQVQMTENGWALVEITVEEPAPEPAPPALAKQLARELIAQKLAETDAQLAAAGETNGASPNNHD